MNKAQSRRIAVSIFLIAFAFGFNITGIAPVLGVLNERYAAMDTSAVQLLQTLTYAPLMLGSLLIGWLTSRFSKRSIALFGLGVIGVCGAIPFLSDSFALLFAARLLIGFGFGVSSPLNTAIVAEFFEPEQRAGYLGLHVVGMGFGAMAGNLLGGVLASFGARYFYLVYLLALGAMAGVAVLLPHTPPDAAQRQGRAKLNRQVYLLSAASFFHTLLITAYSTNIGIYVLEEITSNTAVTGLVTAVNSAFALIVGASFARISKWLGGAALPVSILAAGVGYAAILFVPGVAGVYLGSACCGASLSCFMAQCSLQISVSVEKEAVARASGVFSVIGGVGGLISPILLGVLSQGLAGQNSAGCQFGVGMAGMALLGAAAIVVGKLAKRAVVR